MPWVLCIQPWAPAVRLVLYLMHARPASGGPHHQSMQERTLPLTTAQHSMRLSRLQAVLSSSTPGLKLHALHPHPHVHEHTRRHRGSAAATSPACHCYCHSLVSRQLPVAFSQEASSQCAVGQQGNASGLTEARQKQLRPPVKHTVGHLQGPGTQAQAGGWNSVPIRHGALSAAKFCLELRGHLSAAGGPCILCFAALLLLVTAHQNPKTLADSMSSTTPAASSTGQPAAVEANINVARTEVTPLEGL